MEAIVLAGGLGTRLRSVVQDRPKPMADVQGKPFLQHLMDAWIDRGVTRFILSVGYLHQHIQDYFGDSYRNVPIAYAVETTPLGTGGALSLAVQSLLSEESCLCLNGDTYFPISLPSLVAFHQARKSRFTMVLRRIEHNDRYGSVEIDERGQIERFGEKGNLINGGIYLFSPSLLKSQKSAISCSLEKDLFPLWISRIPFYGIVSDAPFIDIGIPSDYHAFQSHLKDFS